MRLTAELGNIRGRELFSNAQGVLLDVARHDVEAEMGELVEQPASLLDFLRRMEPHLALVEEQVEAIILREGVFRVPKDAGCFVADV